MSNPERRQTWSPDTYQENARFVSDLGNAALNWLAPEKGERILDLGCGDGALTKKIEQAGASVTGVDASEELLARAAERGLDVRRMDGHQLSFKHEFDAVFSNAALHWMLKPLDVIEGVRQALKPGGRFVGEFGGHGNVSSIITAMRAAARIHGGDEDLAGPWFYPTVDEYSDLLVSRGFEVRRISLIPRPTPLKTGMRGWLMTFRKPFFEQFDDAHQAEVLDEVESLLANSLRDSKGNWTADYMRLRFEARLGK